MTFASFRRRTARCSVWTIGIASLLAAACAAHPGNDATSPRLDDASVMPLERVRLYASGVGYFERRGKVDDAVGTLPVPAGHLDDALKTLVVFDSAKRLGAITFPSRLSPAVARARAGLPADQEAVLSYDRLLGSLRGEQVELKVGMNTETETLRGRVIDVVAVAPSHPSYDRQVPNQPLAEGETLPEEREQLQVLLLAESGEILRLDAGHVASVRALDELVERRLHAALSARLATRSNQHQLLDLRGSGQHSDVTLAYLAESPTWRASYRLLIADDSATKRDASRLQAWALVHNDTEEHWRDVRIELVDGRPNSFLFPIAAPRYERRELETPELELSSVPQLSTTTPDAMWGDFSDYQGEGISRIGDEGLSGIGEGGGGRGEGTGLGRVGTLGRGATLTRGSQGESDLLWVGDLARRAGVVSAAAQTTSVHRIAEPLNLAPQHSAMVRFMDSAVRAQPFVWFDDFDAHAQRAVGVSNNTSSTLPAGPLAVYGRGGFLGEAMLESLKPGARQFATISDEPDAALRPGTTSQDKVLRHVDYRNGQLRMHRLQRSTTTLSFDNQSGQARTAYVALPVVRNAKVAGSNGVDYESTSQRAFAVFELAPGRGQERTLATEEGVRQGVALDDLTHELLDELVRTDSVPEREREVLRRAIPALSAWRQSQKAGEELSVQSEALEGDLERLREHLGTLASGESGEAQAQLIQRILTREESLSQLAADQRAATKASEERQSELERLLGEFEQFREEILRERKRQQDADGSGPS